MPSKPKNRTGQIYGNLRVIELSDRRTSSGNAYWWCLCKCGNRREVASDSLSNSKRRKKNVTECKACAQKLAIAAVTKKNSLEEIKRREQAKKARNELIGKVPQEWLKLPLTDSHARELKQKHFFRGKYCLKGHLSPYRINGGCLACAKEQVETKATGNIQ